MWVTIDCERALYVDRGINTILCDRLPSPVTMVLKVALPIDPLLVEATRLWLRQKHVRAIDACRDLADHLQRPSPNFPVYQMRREVCAIWRDLLKVAAA